MFYFVDKFQVRATNAKLVTINNTIRGAKELFQFFCASLRFPYSTVTNFSAFRDVMMELDWLQEKEIIVYHDSLPLLDKQEMAYYIDFLNLIDVEWEKSSERAEIVKKYMKSQGDEIPLDSWINQPPKVFNVYFRLEDKCIIEEIINKYSKNYRECIQYDETGKELCF